MGTGIRNRFKIPIVILTGILLSFPVNLNAAEISQPELIVPIRVYVLNSQKSPELNASITDQELKTVFENVNTIWRQAGITWTIKEIIPHPASAEKLYAMAKDKKSKMSKKERRRAMIQACNIQNWAGDALNLCVVGSMSTIAGGLTFRFKKRLPLVVWPVNVRPKGLILNPATLAHEFGHALGLRHNGKKDIYLMRGGGNNMRRSGKLDQIKFTKMEISFARKNAANMHH